MSRLDTRIPLQVPNTLAQGAQISAMSAADQGTRNALATQMRNDAAAPIRRNALAAQAEGQDLQNLAGEREILGQVVAQLEGMPEQQRAAMWPQAAGYLAQNGVIDPQLADIEYTPELMLEMKTMAAPPAGGESYTLTPGSARFGPGGQLIAHVPAAERPGDKPTTAMQEYEFARSQGFDGSFTDYKQAMKGGGISLTTNPEGGFTFKQGGAGSEAPPNPDARSKEFGKQLGRQDAEKVEERRKFQNGIAALERRDKLLTDNIDAAIKQAEESVWNTGFLGQQSSGIGGTPAFKLNKVLDTIKANLGFNELNAMRQNSPTGGALGNVTEREIEFLQAVQGSLDIGQGDEQLVANLQRIKDGIVANAGERQEAFERDFGEAQAAPQTPEVDLSTVSDDELMRALEATQ